MGGGGEYDKKKSNTRPGFLHLNKKMCFKNIIFASNFMTINFGLFSVD